MPISLLPLHKPRRIMIVIRPVQTQGKVLLPPELLLLMFIKHESILRAAIFCRAPPPPPLNVSDLQTSLTVAGMAVQGDPPNSSTTLQQTVFRETVILQLAFSYQGQPVLVGLAGFNGSSLPRVVTRPPNLPIAVTYQVNKR